MKITTRLISLLLAMLLCLGLAATSAMASSEPEEAEAVMEGSEEPAISEEEASAGEPETAAKQPEEEPEAIDMTDELPAEDGYSYYRDEETGEDVIAEEWAYAAYDEDDGQPGETVELRVVVDGSRENIIYQWYKMPDRMERYEAEREGRVLDSTLIEGATEAVYTATETGSYRCVVTGQRRDSLEGPAGSDSVEIDFYAYIYVPGADEEIRYLSLSPVGDELGYGYLSVTAGYGEPLTMEGTIVKKDGVMIQNERYTWYCFEDREWTKLENASDKSYTIERVTGNGTYRLELFCEFTYRDPDTQETVSRVYTDSCFFDVSVDSGLALDFDTDALMAQPGVVSVTEAEYYGRLTGYNVLMETDQPLTVKSIVSANDGVTCETTWIEEAGGENARTISGAELSITPTKPESWCCTVRDSFGNTRSMELNIILQNHFSARPAGAEPGRHEVNIDASPNGTYELKADVEADDTSNLTYTWVRMLNGVLDHWITYWDYVETEDGGEEFAVGPGQVLTVVCPTESVTYRCVVRDGYGGRENVYFHVNMDGDTYGSAGRMDPIPGDADKDGELTPNDAAVYLRDEDAEAGVNAVNTLKTLVGLPSIG